MKRARRKNSTARGRQKDELLPEYDFSRARRNKYAARYGKDAVVVTLDPDVAAVFPGAAEVNEALRALIAVVKKRTPRRRPPRSA